MGDSRSSSSMLFMAIPFFLRASAHSISVAKSEPWHSHEQYVGTQSLDAHHGDTFREDSASSRQGQDRLALLVVSLMRRKNNHASNRCFLKQFFVRRHLSPASNLGGLALFAIAIPRSISPRPHTIARSAPLLSARSPLDGPPSRPTLDMWTKQAIIMWIAAALLGPLCDGRHSSHDVLHYAVDSIAGSPWLLRLPGTDQVLLETCWWVPVAFGGAGVILGASHPLLDLAWSGGPRKAPGWPVVLAAISVFVGCYEFSGALAQSAAESGAHDLLLLDAPLAACALAMFIIFERSPGGLLMMALLATIGPTVEIGLINYLHLYEYTHPDFANIPSWITWVYAVGGPANGALGRQVLAELEKEKVE